MKSYINICGKKIYYEIYGEKNENVLVYFHGGPRASCLDFSDMASRLSSKLKVICFDQYGVLRSEEIGDGESYGMMMQVDMIEEMRKKLSIYRWSIIGHSYGGQLACLYTKKYPDVVEKIILDCPGLNFQDSVKSIAGYLMKYFIQNGDSESERCCKKIINFEYKDHSFIYELLDLMDKVQDTKIRNYLHNITSEDYMSLCKQNFIANNITENMWAKGEAHVLKIIEEGTMFENFLPILETLKKPVLLLKGHFDPVCTKSQTEYIRKLADTKVVEFRKSGHFPRLEEPDLYENTVIDFLMTQG